MTLQQHGRLELFENDLNSPNMLGFLDSDGTWVSQKDLALELAYAKCLNIWIPFKRM